MESSNETFTCNCQDGWHGKHCEIIDDHCAGVTCKNKGVCRPSFRTYTCECLAESFSGQHCEIVATKIQIYKIVSKSFAYVGIIVMTSVALFIIIMDILKYGLGIDPVETERNRTRRKIQIKKRRPTVQRFIYVNTTVSLLQEQANSTNLETIV